MTSTVKKGGSQGSYQGPGFFGGGRGEMSSTYAFFVLIFLEDGNTSAL